MAPEKIEVTNNKDESRFEAVVDGLTSYVEYRIGADGKMVFTHTEVPEALEGRGIASQMVRAALETARAEKRSIVAVCPYVSTYVQRHPEYADLLAG